MAMTIAGRKTECRVARVFWSKTGHPFVGRDSILKQIRSEPVNADEPSFYIALGDKSPVDIETQLN